MPDGTMKVMEDNFTTGLVDLAAARVGGVALEASDEFFAPKENLLKPGRGVFVADRYTDRGKWMDGWETRRRRDAGHDWVVVRLGLPGRIRGVDVDTNHFVGNQPEAASLEACYAPGQGLPGEVDWSEVLPRSLLSPGSPNLFRVADPGCWTHVRLHIYPDGGVARLRVLGEVEPDWSAYAPEALVDLAGLAQGGRIVACNDERFGRAEHLLLPGAPEGMHDGWETRRRRGPGHDWVVIQLGAPGHIRRVLVDTAFFKGNYPDRCALDGCRVAPGTAVTEADWRCLLPEMKLHPDQVQVFDDALVDGGICTHVRFKIYPDGGVARLRVMGLRTV